MDTAAEADVAELVDTFEELTATPPLLAVRFSPVSYADALPSIKLRAMLTPMPVDAPLPLNCNPNLTTGVTTVATTEPVSLLAIWMSPASAFTMSEGATDPATGVPST